MLPQTTSVWLHDSQPYASGKPGAVHIHRDAALRLSQGDAQLDASLTIFEEVLVTSRLWVNLP